MISAIGDFNKCQMYTYKTVFIKKIEESGNDIKIRIRDIPFRYCWKHCYIAPLSIAVEGGFLCREKSILLACLNLANYENQQQLIKSDKKDFVSFVSI